MLKDINELEYLQGLINSFRGTIDTVQYQIQFDFQGDESQFVDFTKNHRGLDKKKSMLDFAQADNLSAVID